jgi:hypothetical protein
MDPSRISTQVFVPVLVDGDDRRYGVTRGTNGEGFVPGSITSVHLTTPDGSVTVSTATPKVPPPRPADLANRALQRHFLSGAGLPVVIEPEAVFVTVDQQQHEFVGARCGHAWAVEAEIDTFGIRIEATRVLPEDIRLVRRRPDDPR